METLDNHEGAVKVKVKPTHTNITSGDLTPKTVVINGHSYDLHNKTELLEASKALTNASESGKINGVDTTSNEGRMEMSTIRYKLNGVDFDTAERLGKARYGDNEGNPPRPITYSNYQPKRI